MYIVWRHGGLMASALTSGSSSPDLKPWQGTLCSCRTRHFTLTMPLFTQVYKIYGYGQILLLGVTLSWYRLASHVGGSRNTSCYRNQKEALAWWATWLTCRLMYSVNTTLHYITVTIIQLDSNIDFLSSRKWKTVTPTRWYRSGRTNSASLR